MKKFFTLLLVAAATVGTMSATFVSAGTGRAYTFAQLAAIDTSGVTATDSGYVVTADFTIAAGDTLRLMNNDKVMLGDKVMVSVNGYADFAVPDTAVITRATATAAPKGFKVYDTNSGMTMKNVTMEYAGINFGSTNGHLAIDHCTFTLYNGKINSGSVVNYSNSCDGNTVTGSYFVDNTVSALGNGANTPVGLVVDNCVFLRNTTSKRNRPQINMTCGGPYAGRDHTGRRHRPEQHAGPGLYRQGDREGQRHRGQPLWRGHDRTHEPLHRGQHDQKQQL